MIGLIRVSSTVGVVLKVETWGARDMTSSTR